MPEPKWVLDSRVFVTALVGFLPIVIRPFFDLAFSDADLQAIANGLNAIISGSAFIYLMWDRYFNAGGGVIQPLTMLPPPPPKGTSS